ncbi:MAG: neuraminidase-like domain-containing protein, partial [Variibacter sp.]
EQAFTHYLEKLDQVARLEIAGIYEDDDEILHVFGRTFHAPRTYFYRRRDGGTKVWTPWEKVELDIEGDHIIPVLWNGKLMLIWPIFAEKQQDQQVVMPAPGSKVNAGTRYLEIQLAWSEYQRGSWSGKVVSDPVTFMAYQGDDKVLFGDRVAAPQNAAARIRNDGGVGGDVPTGGGGGGGGGQPGGSLPPPPTSPSGDPKPVVRPELLSFKALVAGDTLAVRGYLRRDYRSAPASGDAQIAYPFGEFRFSGCRKIVTAVPNAQVARRNFALAPSGTKFDRMWFTETASSLILFDGTFPTFPNQILPTVLSSVNEPSSIVGNPALTLVNKLDIPVLDRTPRTYRLMAPHQDLQLVGDRPFYFMDDRRTFIGRSTGASGKRLPLTDWVNANLATVWRADYFPAATASPPADGDDPAPAPAAAPPRPLTMLARTRDGRRVAREMVPIDLKPSAPQKTLLPVFWTTRRYQFANFHHPYVCAFVMALRRQGLPALLSLDSQEAADPASFDAYQPQPRVMKAYPIDEVEFAAGGAYEIYNWELFFHIPLLIAARLSSNQRFEDAQRWFHFIFDPTGASGGSVPQRYWRTKPFFDRLSSDYEAESVKAIEELIAQGPPDALKAAVEVWRNDPFNPHAIARLRTTAYQKTVVMKYVDNLVAWADQLFRADTIETINEAAQLYVLAAEILGRRPEIIARNLNRVPETFNSLEPRLGALGNALQDIELLVGSDDEPPASPSPPSPDLPDMAPYFPVPANDKLLGYWDTIGARLFNIRHCMNIEGQARQLPLFEPPIDPALLVRARAAGLSIGEVLSDISVSLPNQRFEAIAQKANEMTAEVRNLGAALMAALEKRDAEALSTLRSGQELRMSQAVRDVRVAQVDEAKANIAALERSRDLAQARKTFYESRETLNALELTSLVLLGASAVPIEISAHLRVLAGLVQRLGNVKLGSPTTAGVEIGGYFIGVGVEEAAIALDAAASILNISSQVIGRTADHGRRKEEWDLQAELATIELKQIDQQLAAAQIRQAMAEAELRNHDRQIEDARDTDDFLRSKFSGQDLYDWTIGKVSGLYFQSYQLAYDLAKRAEMCMQHELGMTYGETSIIRFGYWDSLKKGLMAGDHLAHDLKRLEVAYLDGNIREYEMTKHVSLLALAAGQLIALKETGACEFEIPEWLFDLDTPGHFMRRLKAVSVTIPCVTGPYTTIHCKATLLKSAYRRTADIATGYNRRPPDDPGGPDGRFVDDRKILESIVTSSGQSDTGLFEAQGRDERYLPFEGAGAVSRWWLELPMQFKTFDYNTISDVILHLRYTARDGGEALRAAAAAAVSATLSNAASGVLVRLFSLRHEFPSEWARFARASAAGASSITVDLSAARFPYFTQGRTIAVS